MIDERVSDTLSILETRLVRAQTGVVAHGQCEEEGTRQLVLAEQRSTVVVAVGVAVAVVVVGWQAFSVHAIEHEMLDGEEPGGDLDGALEIAHAHVAALVVACAHKRLTRLEQSAHHLELVRVVEVAKRPYGAPIVVQRIPVTAGNVEEAIVDRSADHLPNVVGLDRTAQLAKVPHERHQARRQRLHAIHQLTHGNATQSIVGVTRRHVEAQAGILYSFSK